MIISLIAAVAENGVIGNANKMIWHLPDDFKYFKRTTLGCDVIMGRKTFESIGSRALPNRKNYVITRNKSFTHNDVGVFSSVEFALECIKSWDEPKEALQLNREVFIIGGAEIYRQFLPYADRLYLTEVHGTFFGDTRFPSYNKSEWDQVSRVHHTTDPKHLVSFDVVVKHRRTDL